MKKYLIILPIALALVGFGAYKAYADIYSSSLVDWYNLDSNSISGTTVTDNSGNGNTGTTVNSPTATVGKLGQALSFNGTSQSIVSPSSSSLNPTYITVSAWIKTSSASVQLIITRDNSSHTGPDGGTGRSWQFRTSSSNIQFIPFNYSTNGAYTGSKNIADGNWHLVTGTWDGTTIRVYVDGLQDGSGSAFSGTLRTSTAELFISGSSTLGGYWFNGSIDDVRIYNRALSAQEVQQLYYQTMGAHGGPF